MAVLTPQQITAIDTKLSVSLPTLTDDKIIELCLLQRAAPEVKPAFVEALNTEITRRFTASEIAANDVMFSVIQNFANQFTSGIPLFAKKMLEMSASVNRDIWFSNNSIMFAEAIEDVTLLAWLITKPDVVTKILSNTLGLTAVAKSTKASTAILSNSETVVILKATTNVWQIVTGQSQFMNVLVVSSEMMTYVINNIVAMEAVAASSIAMEAVAASSTVLAAIVKSTTARNALMSSNTILQANRVAIYNTVVANWTKQAGVNSGEVNNGESMTVINSAIANPSGFVFASLGRGGAYSSQGETEVKHPNGVLARQANTSVNPTNLTNLDVITTNGAIFTAKVNRGWSYAELWIPPTI